LKAYVMGENVHSAPLPLARAGYPSAVVLATWLIGGIAIVGLDESIQPHFKAFGRSDLPNSVARYWQDMGAFPGIALFLAAGLFTAIWDRGQTFFRFAICVALAGVVVQVIKHLVGRARPDWVQDATRFYGPLGIWNHGPSVPIDSMPSGHTAAAFAMAVALSWRWPRARALWFVVAAGVGVSRILVDRHFLSDVTLGALLGTVIAVAALKRTTTVPVASCS
jgi:membrane-associated phospholipid phosphatase